MSRSIRKVAVFVGCVVVFLVITSPAQGQQSKEEKVKLTGAEVQELLLQPGVTTFGVDPNAQTVWIIVSHGDGKRDFHWRSMANAMVWSTAAGIAKITGDQICGRWDWGGPETCFDVYRIGQDKYESRHPSLHTITWYKGQKPPEGGAKDKVKLTGAELQKLASTASFSASIGGRPSGVSITETDGSGKRAVYWRSLEKLSVSGSDNTGASRVVGDQFCMTSRWSQNERCADIYSIGEDTFEVWIDGQASSRMYRLK